MAGGTKIGSMYMSIGGDLAPLDRALNSAKSAASAAGRKVDQTFAAMKRSAQSVENAVFSLKGMLVGLGSAAAIYKANAALSESIALSNEQIAMETRLQAVLKATGQAAGYNIDELKAMAGGMQAVTTVGDEVILKGMAILATFKEVRGEGFERATMAALDMAEVMGQDLNSSILQIGKALNDPTRGLTALSKAGVTFTEEQREQVKVLQQSGQMMEAQSLILRELEQQFGGTAAAARITFKGSVDAAGNAFGDLYEQVGYTVTKSQEMISVAQRFEGVFNNWIAAVERGQASSEGLDGSFDELLLTLDEVGQEFFETLPGRINATITAIGSASAKVAELTGTVDALAQKAGGWGQVSDYGLAGYALFGKPGPLKFVAVLNTVHAAYAAVMGLKDQLAQSNSDLFGVDQVGMELVQVQEQIAAIEATESRRFAVKQKRLEELMQTEAELQAEMERRLDVQIRVSDELDTLMASEAAFTGAVGQAAEAFKGANQEMVAAKKAATTAICAENKKIVSCEETKGRALLKAAHEQWTLNQELNDNLASSEAEKNAKVLAEVEQLMEDRKELWEGSSAEIVGLQELLVNDLGRIGNSYFNEILSGQLRTGEDMIQGFFDYIKAAAARLLAQLATNSLVDAIFGGGASGGLTLAGAFGGGGLFSSASSGLSVAGAAQQAGSWLGIGGSGAAVAPYVTGGGQALGATAVPVTITGAAPGALPSGMGFGYGGSVGSGGAAAGVGLSASMLTVAAIPGIVALGELLGTKYERYDDGAVRMRSGDPAADYAKSMEDSLASLNKALNRAGDSTKLYESTLNLAETRVRYLAGTIGDATAQASLGVEGTVASMDSLLDSLLGYDLAQQDSAAILGLAREAVEGTTGATDAMRETLTRLGLQSDDAATAVIGIVSALRSIPEEINIDVKVNQGIVNSINHKPVVQASGTVSDYAGDSSGFAYSEWLQSNHAAGGIFSSATLLPSVNGWPHQVGEAGPEAITPLHAGPDTLKKMHDDIRAISDRPIVINFHGDAAALRQFIRLEADQLRVEVNDANLDPLQRAVY